MLWIVLTLAATSAAQMIERMTSAVGHAKGPHWSVEDQALYWVDMTGSDIWRYHPESGDTTRAHIGSGDVTVIIPMKNEDNTFVVAVCNELKILKWDGRNDSQPELSDFLSFPLSKGVRLNNGKADSHNRLWIGTIGPQENYVVEKGKAALYKVICKDYKLEGQLQVKHVTISNGITWSSDGTIMYYMDTPTRKIEAFDFHSPSGTISNRRVIFDFEVHNIQGTPDSMTIDTDDNLWVAVYGGGAVIVIEPYLGKLLNAYSIPLVMLVTSVAWGGEHLDVLYITTSSRGNVRGGELYQLKNTGARGRPAHRMLRPDCEADY